MFTYRINLKEGPIIIVMRSYHCRTILRFDNWANLSTTSSMSILEIIYELYEFYQILLIRRGLTFNNAFCIKSVRAVISLYNSTINVTGFEDSKFVNPRAK